MMGFVFNIYFTMEVFKMVCKNPWCKGHFTYTEADFETISDGGKVAPIYCNKCKSFNKDLSGGVTWTNKDYEGNPWIGAHEINIKVNRYK